MVEKEVKKDSRENVYNNIPDEVPININVKQSFYKLLEEHKENEKIREGVKDKVDKLEALIKSNVKEVDEFKSDLAVIEEISSKLDGSINDIKALNLKMVKLDLVEGGINTLSGRIKAYEENLEVAIKNINDLTKEVKIKFGFILLSVSITTILVSSAFIIIPLWVK